MFAVGDVRAGSVKRVAAAVGDGAQVVAAIHSYSPPPPNPELAIAPYAGYGHRLTRFAARSFCPKARRCCSPSMPETPISCLRCVKGGEIRARWRIATDARRTADQYAVWLHQLLELEGYHSADVGAVIIGTVVPRALHNLEVLATKYFHVEPLIAGEGAAAWPLQLDVDEPQNVGAGPCA